MENNINKVSKEEVPVYKILKQIKDGVLQAKELPKEARQDCVEVLTLEGYSVPSIAQLLDRSEKTVKRDLEEIWQRNSKRPTPEIVLQLIAEMVGKSESQQAHLMRVARSNEGSVQERINAERLAWEIKNQTVERLQSLGYMPTAAQKIVGDVYHHDSEEEAPKTLAQMREELLQIEKIAEETGSLDEKTKQGITLLRLKIDQAEIAQGIAQLANNKVKETEEKKEG